MWCSWALCACWYVTHIYDLFWVKALENPPCLLRDKLVALYSGMFGILVACYGNQILGQLPTNVAIYLSISFLYVFTKDEYYEQAVDTTNR
jgi:hypothetical protein